MRIIMWMAVLAAFSGCNNQANNGKEQADSLDKDSSIHGTPGVNKNDTVFTAFGNEPFWQLSVIENVKYLFHPMDGADVEVPWAAQTTMDSTTTRYASSSGNNNIVLLIMKKNCSDGMSDEQHHFAVDVTVNGTHYSGCGRTEK